jgi:hypothetical protein
LTRVIFEGVGMDECDRKIQSSIANIIKNKLEREPVCDCKNSHVVVRVGGMWRTGDFVIEEVTGCCLKSLDKANEILLAPSSRSSIVAGFTRSAMTISGTSREQALSLFSLR